MARSLKRGREIGAFERKLKVNAQVVLKELFLVEATGLVHDSVVHWLSLFKLHHLQNSAVFQDIVVIAVWPGTKVQVLFFFFFFLKYFLQASRSYRQSLLEGLPNSIVELCTTVIPFYISHFTRYRKFC